MTRAQGVDVSRYQLTTPSLAGRSFLIARATVGLKVDTMYAEHIRNARKAGLMVGAYAFTYDFLSAVSQADAFMAAAGDVDFYFNDVEGGDKQRPSQAQDFHDRIRSQWGKQSGLYMSESVFYIGITVDYRWVANWSHEPNIAWDFWQKRGSPLDLDEYHGTAAELRARFGISPAPPSDTEPSVIVPQHLGHCVVTAAEARIYPDPDGNATPIASTLPKGTRLRTFGAVSGWRYCQVNLGGVENYAWFRADETDDDPQPLTVTDGVPDCSAQISAATSKLTTQVQTLKAKAKGHAAQDVADANAFATDIANT